MGPLTVLVALEREVDGIAVEASLSGEGIQVVGFVHGLEDESNPQQDTPSDVLVLACAEPSAGIHVIDLPLTPSRVFALLDGVRGG